MNSAFQEEYPNITIDRVSRSFEDLQSTLRGDHRRRATRPGAGQQRPGRHGAFVEAGLLTNLDPYLEAYGWADRYPEAVLAYSSYTDDGATFGEGSLWGLPQMGEVVGFYYNKPLLDGLGIAAPVTWEEDCRTAGAVGRRTCPASTSSAPYRAVTYRRTRSATSASAGPVPTGPARRTSRPRRPSSTGSPAAGYVTPDFNGITPDDAWQAFARGEGVFMLGGTWLLADLTEAMGDDVGFTVLLGAGSDTPVATGGTSLPFAITAASENTDAAAYIDFLTSSEAMTVVTETGNLPIIGPPNSRCRRRCRGRRSPPRTP